MEQSAILSAVKGDELAVELKITGFNVYRCTNMKPYLDECTSLDLTVPGNRFVVE